MAWSGPYPLVVSLNCLQKNILRSKTLLPQLKNYETQNIYNGRFLNQKNRQKQAFCHKVIGVLIPRKLQVPLVDENPTADARRSFQGAAR